MLSEIVWGAVLVLAEVRLLKLNLTALSWSTGFVWDVMRGKTDNRAAVRREEILD